MRRTCFRCVYVPWPIDVDLAVSNVHPQSTTTPDPSRPRLRDVRKKFQSSTSAIANSGKGAEHTWLSYPVEEVSEYLVKDELKGERRVAGRGRWCVREPCGGDSTCNAVDCMGGNGLEAAGLQLCQKNLSLEA